MPTLTITTTYADGSTLTAAMLDAIKTQIQTFVNTTKLDADNLQDSAITTAKLAAASVTTAKIATGAISIDTQISPNVITASHMTPNSINTDELFDGAVTTAKIAANAVTYAKTDAANIQTSSSAATQSTTSSSFTAITNATTNITASSATKSRMIVLANVSAGAAGGIYVEADVVNSSGAHFKITRDTVPTSGSETDLATHIVAAEGGGVTEIGSLTFFDFTALSSGTTYVYKAYFKAIAVGTATAGVTNVKLTVLEI